MEYIEMIAKGLNIEPHLLFYNETSQEKENLKLYLLKMLINYAR